MNGDGAIVKVLMAIADSANGEMKVVQLTFPFIFISRGKGYN